MLVLGDTERIVPSEKQHLRLAGCSTKCRRRTSVTRVPFLGRSWWLKKCSRGRGYEAGQGEGACMPTSSAESKELFVVACCSGTKAVAGFFYATLCGSK
ncbi:hypothetical protein PR202_gb06255 [Eleusine coracana subsp. coracana]|uniref:Uncharacterized protein n=1 Tax=Eleusine coracana subsp. coracana TaxID=191504 RepID=A0AAV5E950_ELECO|nr:hypothetical protein PR202_gb06255 [Eleusine coracana subsp. coracana]